ncbi:MAG: ComF family protein [Pseudomonadota bacterium]
MRPVVDLVYPPRCPMCGDAIADQGGLCIECWGELEVPGEPACTTCSRPLGTDSGSQPGQCTPCQLDPPRHSGIAAATIYNDTSRKLILTYKHGGKIALAPLLGRLMAARLPEPTFDAPPLLIPVPLHRWRLWQRGFNQAALLARELERSGKGTLLVDGLVRRKRTPSLGGLGREAREQALSGAIAVRATRAGAIKGRDVVLVDDVLTSGATSDACVQALLGNGAKSVTIACFARVLDGHSTHRKE